MIISSDYSRRADFHCRIGLSKLATTPSAFLIQKLPDTYITTSGPTIFVNNVTFKSNDNKPVQKTKIPNKTLYLRQKSEVYSGQILSPFYLRSSLLLRVLRTAFALRTQLSSQCISKIFRDIP